MFYIYHIYIVNAQNGKGCRSGNILNNRYVYIRNEFTRYDCADNSDALFCNLLCCVTTLAKDKVSFSLADIKLQSLSLYNITLSNRKSGCAHVMTSNRLEI